MRAQQRVQRRIAALPVKPSARPRLTVVMAPEPDRCALCGGIIERFDRGVFLLHERCAPCHEALDQE